jgi:hypothetical protein
MARFVIKTPVITVNGVDLSDHCSEVTIVTSRPEVDFTSFQAAFAETLAGIGDATITAQFFQDYAAGKVDATLWPLSSSDTPFVVTVKATNAAVGATNPRFDMTCLLFEYTPMGGAIGTASQTPVTFRNAAAAGLTRNIV